MARSPWPGDGVGRGNGIGSARTQFKSGMPSANPYGRPKRAKQAPNRSLKEAVLKGMGEHISTIEDGVARKRSRTEAMIMLLFAQYRSAKPREQIANLKYLGSIAPEVELDSAPRKITASAVHDLVAALAREGLIDGQE